MFIRKWGDGKKNALLLHGMSGSSNIWEELGIILSKNDYTVYAPDLSGHGLSQRELEYSVDFWIKDIKENFENIDLLIGHSIGGQIALQIKDFYQPEKTVLIDPVLSLPKIFPKTIIQNTFKMSIQASKYKNKRHPNEKIVYNHTHWSNQTIQALDSIKKDFKENFLSLPKNSENILLIKPSKSFVATNRAIKQFGFELTVAIKHAPHGIPIHNNKEMCQIINSFLNDEEYAIKIKAINNNNTNINTYIFIAKTKTQQAKNHTYNFLNKQYGYLVNNIINKKQLA